MASLPNGCAQVDGRLKSPARAMLQLCSLQPLTMRNPRRSPGDRVLDVDHKSLGVDRAQRGRRTPCTFHFGLVSILKDQKPPLCCGPQESPPSIQGHIDRGRKLVVRRRWRLRHPRLPQCDHRTRWHRGHPDPKERSPVKRGLPSGPSPQRNPPRHAALWPRVLEALDRIPCPQPRRRQDAVP